MCVLCTSGTAVVVLLSKTRLGVVVVVVSLLRKIKQNIKLVNQNYCVVKINTVGALDTAVNVCVL